MGFGALDATGVSPGIGGGSPEIHDRRPRDAHGCGCGLGLGFEPFFFFSTSIYLVLTDEGSDNFGVGENNFFSNFLHFLFSACLTSEAYMEKSCMKLPICSQPSEYWGGQGSLQVTRCFYF